MTSKTDAPEPSEGDSSRPVAWSTRASLRSRGAHLARRLVRPGLEVSTVAALASLLAAWFYRVDLMSVRVPISYRGDALVNQSAIKSIIEQGWWLTNDRLGAPFGQIHYDFPFGGENLHFLVLKVMGTFSTDSGLLINIYYLAGFPLVAAVTFLVCRHLRFSFGISAAVSILYTFLPYHFWHGQGHLTRSTYVGAPLIVLLVLWTMAGPASFRTGGEPGRWNRRRLVAAAVFAVVVATTDTVLCAFALVFLVTMTAIAALRRRSGRHVVPGLALAGLIFAAFALSNLPTLVYAAENGTNEVAGRRSIAESEYFGLKISDMILPVPGHRVPALAALQSETELSPVRSEGGQALGLLGAVGFLALVVRAISRLVAGPSASSRRGELVDKLAAIAVVATLFGTVSGLSLVLSLFGTSQIRTWNRIVVIIALCSLLAVAAGLEVLWRRVRRRSVVRRWPRVLGALGLVAVVAFGLFDQVSYEHPTYRRLDAVWLSDRDFVQAIEARLPTGAAVFQLPIIPFPEAGEREGMKDYDHLKGYLHSEDLRWSYGGVKGRPRADWQDELIGEPVNEVARAVAAVGFDGIWVDRFGYEDLGADLEARLADVTGVAPLVSENQRLVFFDLRPLRADLEEWLGPEVLDDLAERTLGRPSPLRQT